MEASEQAPPPPPGPGPGPTGGALLRPQSVVVVVAGRICLGALAAAALVPIWFVLMLFVGGADWGAPQNWGFFGSLAAAGVAAAVWLVAAVFTRTQVRLGELYLTLCLPGLLCAVSSARLTGLSPVVPWQLASVGLSYLAGLFLFGLGSAWGWGAAQRLREERPWVRYLLLVYGWLLVLGACTVSVAVGDLSLVLEAAGDSGWSFAGFLVLALGQLPGLDIEQTILRGTRSRFLPAREASRPAAPG
ncbi:MAG: hypothetical protein HYZ53_25250 [Planctomycetes bacterium]|nr:hypothetical protein [Planctomycetota bacterium]